MGEFGHMSVIEVDLFCAVFGDKLTGEEEGALCEQLERLSRFEAGEGERGGKAEPTNGTSG